MNLGDPMWTAKITEKDLAQDPLAMDRVRNRLVSDLLPGITTISPRPRYYAHHLWAVMDIARRDDPSTRAEFNRGMYRRERLLMLAAVAHSMETHISPRNHDQIVGIRSGSKQLRNGNDAIPLDFRFVDHRGGSYGRDYRASLRTMGLVYRPDGDPCDRLSERGKPIASAYDQLARELSLHELAAEESISVAEIEGLADDLCLCAVCADNAPDRAPLRDAFFGWETASESGNPAQRRAQSLQLILQFAQYIEQEDGDSLSPSEFLDFCYYRTLTTESGQISVDIPEKLSQQQARWKVLRAHDYFAYATEVVLVGWLEYLERKSPEPGTVATYIDEVRSPSVMAQLGAVLDRPSLDETTPLESMLTDLWSREAVTWLIEGAEISPTVPFSHTTREHVLDRELTAALSAGNWVNVHSLWPCILLAVVLRFGNPTGQTESAWQWLASRTRSDLSPARLRIDIKEHLRNDSTIGDFLEWFIKQYVIRQAEEVRRDKAKAATQFKGWFEQEGTGWVQTRTHSARHWSARFDSAVSVLRDLSLLDPDPTIVSVTAAGAAAIAHPTTEDK
ncbi:hypothetical protein [Haloferax sp. DFSO52]|uniref:hypothetical protein n=1 Tax=Haloferax sp. DFSO52 TaxID=3388505 RepID=UPI003A8B7617